MKLLSTISIFLFCSASVVSQTDWVNKNVYAGGAKHHPVTFSIDGVGYALTGTDPSNTVTKDFHSYDPATDTWTKLADFPGVARSFAYGAVYNGKAYVGFGSTQTLAALNDLWEYDPVTGVWKRLKQCGCIGREHPAFVITSNGRLYVGAGANRTVGNLNDWWEYNIATNTWYKMPDVPGTGRHHPFHFGIGTDAFMGMGHGSVSVSGKVQNSTNIYRDWYKFNSLDSTWKKMNDFPGEGRVAGSQFQTNKYGYVISGEDELHEEFDSGQFYMYKPDLDQWVEQQAHPRSARWAPGTFVIDKQLYLIAGTENRRRAVNTVISYDLDLIPEEKKDTDDNAKDTIDITSVNHSNIQNGNIILFPNPVSNVLNLKGLSVETSELTIYNTGGQMVLKEMLQENEASISVESMDRGIYIIEIKTDLSIHRTNVVIK